jgi:hypothetical protein
VNNIRGRVAVGIDFGCERSLAANTDVQTNHTS